MHVGPPDPLLCGGTPPCSRLGLHWRHPAPGSGGPPSTKKCMLQAPDMHVTAAWPMMKGGAGSLGPGPKPYGRCLTWWKLWERT